MVSYILGNRSSTFTLSLGWRSKAVMVGRVIKPVMTNKIVN